VSTPILSVEGLEKRFGALVALRGVDLTLAAGSALAILGPNGAGKSTLLRILAGLAHATSGRVSLATASGPRTGIGYLGHATLLYPELTARENLIFAARMYGVDEPAARANVLLEEEGLADARERRAGTFSRGMAQRLSIARARVHDPALMLLDEPYTGLDRRSSERLSERLSGLREAGHSLVMVTHDIAHTAGLVDAAIILVRGRVAHRAEGAELEPARLEAAYLAALESGR
jgi:heme exporter protein A